MLPLLLAFFCLSGAGLLAWRGDLPCWLAIYYAGLSLLTFLVYGWDKRAARLQQRRVAESTLHTMSLAGGWPGALIAQNRLRHKSRKVAFLVRFWCTVIVNLVVVYWLYFQI
ncbi:DUF1294 domain-containing protein [Chromatiaceae bacterium AAb-1]|nr:DUF1294 domain-containing protein [Chromatiaceae bacterium AAb-1]